MIIGHFDKPVWGNVFYHIWVRTGSPFLTTQVGSRQHETKCVLCNLDNCVKLRELQCGFAILPTLWAVGPLLRPTSGTLGAGFGQVSLSTASHHYHLISAGNLAPAIQSPIIQLKQSMEQISLCRGRVPTTSPRVGNA